MSVTAERRTAPASRRSTPDDGGGVPADRGEPTRTGRRCALKDDDMSMHLGRVRRQGASARGAASRRSASAAATRVGAHAHQPARVPLRRHRGACTSARRPSRSTTPTRREQIEYLVADAGATRSWSPSRRFLDTVLAAKEAATRSSTSSWSTATAREGALSLDDVRGAATDGLRLRGRLARRRARRPAHADLHVRHDRAAEGRPAHAREPARRPCARSTRSSPFPDGASVVSCLPMAHIAERACSHYLPIVLGFTITCCPDPRAGRGATCPRCARPGSSRCRASGRS